MRKKNTLCPLNQAKRQSLSKSFRSSPSISKVEGLVIHWGRYRTIKTNMDNIYCKAFVKRVVERSGESLRSKNQDELLSKYFDLPEGLPPTLPTRE